MPQLYHLNPPPNPFWDFVAGIEDHPFFHGEPPRARFPFNAPPPPPAPEAQQPAAEVEPQMSEKVQGKQASVEDPPEVDPATLRGESAAKEQGRSSGIPFRGRGRCGGDEEEEEGDRRREGRGCRGRGGARGRGGWGGPWAGHRAGPPPFTFGGHPFFGGPRAHHGPHGHHHGPHSHPHGPPHEHARGPHRRHSPPHHRGPGGPGAFDLGGFLNNLGERLGVDLSGAAEGLGLDRFSGTRTNQDADFEPRTDIFENQTQYTIHLSLPGAKKEDVGVDWDGENSVLRIAGVVHRPGADEQMLNEMVVDGRKRETGVFEKAIRLGTKQDPASIDVTGINAKMTDGVLVVKVPKVDVVHEKREVPINGSHSPSPHGNERSAVFDADHEMYDTVNDARVPDLMDQDVVEEKRTEALEHTQSRTISPEPNTSSKEKEAAQKQTAAEEQLPVYQAGDATHEEEDWERSSDEEEGDFVKINVN